LVFRRARELSVFNEKNKDELMNVKHFTFLFLLCLSGCQLLTRPQQLEPVSPTGLSILQGATDQTSTQINLVTPNTDPYEITLSMEKSLLQTPEQKVFTHPKSSAQIIQVNLKDLTPELTYTLKVYDKNKTLIDERFFRTLPKELKKARIFVISCTNDSYEELQKKQWSQIQGQKPDFLFLIGDNVYTDISPLGPLTTVDDEVLWRRYAETRDKLLLYKMKHLVPTYATWDDHDFGINDGNSLYPHKEYSKNIFKTFFPMGENAALTSGPGVASRLVLGKQQFLFLDDRFFRSPKKALPQSHFGEEQEKWALEAIQKHQGPTWLISGDQFFGGYHPFESYEGDHPEAFKNFLKKIKNTKKVVLFISGDRHVAEIMKIEKPLLGYETFEFTSSGLHAKMYPGSLAKTPNKRFYFGKDGESNYLSLDLDLTNQNPLYLDAVFWGEDQKVHYQNKLEIKK
jgi:alkaline phosphatase D